MERNNSTIFQRDGSRTQQNIYISESNSNGNIMQAVVLEKRIYYALLTQTIN